MNRRLIVNYVCAFKKSRSEAPLSELECNNGDQERPLLEILVETQTTISKNLDIVVANSWLRMICNLLST